MNAAAPIDVSFTCMGSRARLIAWPSPEPAARARARDLLADARAWLEDYDARLSRFRPDSELSRLNADPRPVVPASPLLYDAIAAALWAAQRTEGLVDPTVAGALVRAGYATSRAGVAPAPLDEAIAAAPRRRPARPAPSATWRAISLDGGLIHRPPGIVLDTGGTGKGLAADRVAQRLAELPRFVVDCGGDVRAGGTASSGWPVPVEVAWPGRAEGRATVVELADGAVASSGIDARLWRQDGGFAHHLIDPATGAPAWTGVIGATALAPTALEAETLAKAAVLAGPHAGARWLAAGGGVVFADDGTATHVRPQPVVRLAELAVHRNGACA
jgi:thiamine biosynthesis lipoprotein